MASRSRWKSRHLQLPLRGVLVDRAHRGLQAPFRAASGAMATRVESAGNRAQAVVT
jgi:hypothetical protein